ncbi:MAG: lyase family protein, partial [Chloroflexota bacterium]|nr:lyase family protein [Chloroflexota bacterium]
AVARARADILAALLRLALRERLLGVAAAVEGTRAALLDLAAAHAVTLMPAYSGGQAAQPTTFGHFLGGVVAPLGRAAGRVSAAYAEVNRSPLGAVALASTSLGIDRERVAALLGFDGLAVNTYDAVAATDHVAAAANAVAGIASSLGRFLAELLAWLRTEPTSFRLGDAWLGHDPALPQLRAPVGVERLLLAVRRVEADATALVSLSRDAGYGPVGAATDLLEQTARVVLEGAADVATRTTELLGDLEVNRAYLANRAGRAHTTSGDLADFLMTEERLEPAAARNVAALTVARAIPSGVEVSGITPEMIDAAALAVIGRELGVEVEQISRHLAPRRFIERRTATGSPSPAATRAYLDQERLRLGADTRWREEASARISAAFAELDRIGAEVSAR